MYRALDPARIIETLVVGEDENASADSTALLAEVTPRSR